MSLNIVPIKANDSKNLYYDIFFNLGDVRFPNKSAIENVLEILSTWIGTLYFSKEKNIEITYIEYSYRIVIKDIGNSLCLIEYHDYDNIISKKCNFNTFKLELAQKSIDILSFLDVCSEEVNSTLRLAELIVLNINKSAL